MSIPDEAVEAAARVIAREVLRTANSRDVSPVDLARLALEAAAPHILAPILALADQWQEDFPYKANQLRDLANNLKEQG